MRAHPHIEGTPWEVLGAAYGVCTWWVPSVCSEGIEVCVDEDGWAPPRARVLCELANVSEEDRVWFREGGRALADARARYGAPFRLRGSGRWDDPGWEEVGEDPPMDVFEDLWGGGAW